MKLVTFLSILFVSLQTFAIQEIEVVVADQSFNSSSKVVITEKEIKNSHVADLPTLIAAEANVTTSTANSFTPTSIFVRGGDSSHVLFLIDGIPTYDATTIQRTISMSLLNMRAIKKIEIIKGPQVVLYGGQAMAAVIKIETFPTELKTSTDVMVQGGERYADGSVAQQVKIGDNQAFSGSVRFTDEYSLSPALDSTKTYPARATNVGLTYINRFNPEQNLEALFKADYLDQTSQIASSDNVTGKSADIEDFNAPTKAINFAAIVRKKDVFSLSLTNQNSDRSFELNTASQTTSVDEAYEGLVQNVRLDVSLLNWEKARIDSGLSYTRENLIYRSYGVQGADETREYEGIFVKGAFKLTENILFEPGYRKELELMTSLADTYQAGLSYKDNVKLEFAKAFKTPSLFQLYGYVGNPDLEPERVTTTSLSFEGNILDSIHNSLTFFRSDYRNLYETAAAPPPKYVQFVNVGKAYIKGVEYFASWDGLATGTQVQLSLGYQEPRDLNRDTWLSKRALRTGSVKVNQSLAGDQAHVGLEAVHVGDRRDSYRAGGTKFATLSQYTLTHLVAQYKVQDNLNVFTRAENIFSQQYESAYGYYVDGPVVRAGVNYSLE